MFYLNVIVLSFWGSYQSYEFSDKKNGINSKQRLIRLFSFQPVFLPMSNFFKRPSAPTGLLVRITHGDRA